MNADDLISGSITIKVNKVTLNASDQPVSIHYDGGEGRPFKPCKSMRRVLILAWGSDGDDYIGKSMTLFADPKVKWAGAEIGGIRISHLSHIEGKLRMMLTETRGKKSPFVVEPLVIELGAAMSDDQFAEFSSAIEEAATMEELQLVGGMIKAGKFDDVGNKRIKRVYSKAMKAMRADID
jgi:hypothetical protein